MRAPAFASFLFLTAVLTGAAIAGEADPAVKALSGGTALPAAKVDLVIPAIAKQSISFTSNADEVIVGTVAVPGEGVLGTLSLDGTAGTGTGSISIPTASLKTGNEMRDGHLASAGWMDAAKFPQITFTDVTFTKVADTVWKAKGTWTMHGVAKPLEIMANIRLVPEVPPLGKNIVRIKSAFALDLKEFGLSNASIGGPTVAQTWDVSINLLAIDKAAAEKK